MKKIVALLFVASFLVACQQEKTAYVDNDILMKNYEGLQTANKDYQSRLQKLQDIWQKKGQAFQTKVQAFQKKAGRLSKSAQKEQREALLKEQQQLQQTQRLQQSLLVQQRKHASDSIEKIIKNEIKTYAEAHNYVYVFGANPDDNILYAQESKNITQDILTKLNDGVSTPVSKDSTNTK